MEKNKDLEKFVNGELQVMSPLLVKSKSFLVEANKVVVKDKDSLAEAKRQKKEMVEHRNSVKDLRLTFTRTLDGMKAQFIEKQDEVLAPSIEAEGILKERIFDYEEEQRKIKEAENARVQEIIESLYMPKFDRKSITEDEAIKAKVDFDMTVNALDKKDRSKKAVKEQIISTRELFEELITHVKTRDEQRATAIAQEKERRALEDEQRKLQKEKAEAGGPVDNVSVPGVPDVPADVAGPDSTPSHQSDQSPYSLVRDLGIECMSSVTKVLAERLSGIEGLALEGEAYEEWKVDTAEAMYVVIEKYS